MLFVTIIDREGIRQTFSWHVTDSLAIHERVLVQNDIIVQADGDELRSIRNNIPNLPILLTDHKNYSVQKWYGDAARFIVGNLLR
jgi:hypothetical protein